MCDVVYCVYMWYMYLFWVMWTVCMRCMYVVLYAYGCVVQVCECVQLYVVFVHICIPGECMHVGACCVSGYVCACVPVYSVCLGLIFGRMELLLPCLLHICLVLCKVFSVKKTSIKLPSRKPSRCKTCRDSFFSTSFMNQALPPLTRRTLTVESLAQDSTARKWCVQDSVLDSLVNEEFNILY